MSEVAPTKPHGALETALRKVENFAAIIAGVVMIISMFLTFMDALLRYLVGSPFAFTTYLNEHYLLAAMLCLPLAWGFRQEGGYLRFIAIFGVMSKSAGDLLIRAGLVLSAGFVAVLAVSSWSRFVDAFVHNDIQMGVIDWPVAWQWLPVPVGLGLLTLRIIFIAFGPSENLHSGDESHGDEL